MRRYARYEKSQTRVSGIFRTCAMFRQAPKNYFYSCIEKLAVMQKETVRGIRKSQSLSFETL